MPDKQLIYDIGMHRGEDTAYYLKRGFRVLGIEADPELAAGCRKTFSHALGEKRLTLLEGAITQHNTPHVTFYRNREHSLWGTIDPAWVKRNQGRGTHHEPIQVERIDLHTCLEQYGVPYYMKIDIEGADIVCLRALSDCTAKPFYLSMESEMKSFERLQEEIHLLCQLGYDAFRAVQQSNVHTRANTLQLPVHPPHHFEYDCSGPLPEEFPDRWQPERAILKTYRRIFWQYRFLGTDSRLWQSKFGRRQIRALGKRLGREVPGWYDTHARHSTATQKNSKLPDKTQPLSPPVQ